MILFRTYNYPNYYSAWATKGSYDLTVKIRESLDLPTISWRGMNAAWPLYQGFVDKSARSSSLCANKACGTMTYPSFAVPEGLPRSKRVLSDPGNPLGAYFCGSCANYRDRHGSIPDEKILPKLIARRKVLRDALQAAGKSAVCYSCDRTESMFQVKNVKDKGREYGTDKVFRVHDRLPQRFLCDLCYKFFDREGRVRTPDEVEATLLAAFLVETRVAGGEIWCDNCKAVEGSGSRTLHITHHIYPELRMVLCNQCPSQTPPVLVAMLRLTISCDILLASASSKMVSFSSAG